MPTVTGIATSFIDFTRASNATVTDSDGKVKWAPHNLLTNSESFDAAAWFKSGANATANAGAAPNGTTTADKLVETAATTSFLAVQSITGASYPVTFAVYVKAAERTAMYLRLYIGTNNWEAAVFDLATGTNSQNASGSASTFTQKTQSIETIGNGWYRCSITAIFPSASVGCNVMLSNVASGLTFATASGEYSYAGVASNGLFVWGAAAYRSDLGGMQPNTSAYPMYNPTTPKNLLGYTEALSNAAWVVLNGGASAPTKGTTSGTKPNGLTGTIDTLTIPAVAASQWSALYQNAGAAFANIPITFSVYARVASGSATIYLNVEDIGAGPSGGNFIASTAKTLDTTWQRISVTGTRTTTVGNSIVVIGFDTRCAAGQTNASPITVELWGAQLSDSASLDPYVPVYGAAVTSAAYYGPRRDFDPVTLACKGLLVEEQRANLLLYSAQFDDASWIKGSATVTANAGVAPDGASTADKIVEDTSTNSHSVRRSAGVANATVYTYSAFIKAAGRTQVVLQYFDGTTNKYPVFDLTTGAKVTDNGIGTSWTATNVGNGWWRFSITVTSASVSTECYIYPASGGTNGYTGNGIDGILVWGAQLEAGSFATSYIPTGAATATRNADVASVSTQAFPYSQTEGTMVVSGTFVAPSQSGVSSMVSLNNGSSAESINIYRQSSQIQNNVTVVGVPQAGYTITAPADLTKSAIAYKLNDTNSAVNGTAQTTDTTCTVPTVDRMEIGRLWGGSFGANGWIRQITYLPRRISNAELVTRST